MERSLSLQDLQGCKNGGKLDLLRFESPKRVNSAFRVIDPHSTAIAKSPFSKFVDELDPLPDPLAQKTPRSNLPREMMLFRTPDKEFQIVEGRIAEKLDFDALGVSARKPNLDVIEGEESEEENSQSLEAEISLSSECSSPSLQQAANHSEPLIITISQVDHLVDPSQHSKDSSKPGKVCCNCKKSRCLKLYCDCFRNNQLCEGCNCVQCLNTSEHCPERYNAVLNMIETNPQAFQPKIESQKHTKGCNCKKSYCLKKYCECYQAGLECSDLCRCQDCKNTKPHDHLPKSKSRQRVKLMDS